jgi:Secretion system C-terminal sorting domain
LTKNDIYTFSSILNCETNPVTFKWEFSTTGFNYTTIGTASTVNLSITKQSYLSLTVIDALGKTNRVTITLTVNTSNQQPIRQNNNTSTVFADNIEKVKAYPNPVTGDEFNLDFNVVNDNQDISIDLIDNEGKILSNISKKGLNKGSYIESINIKDVSNGIYTIKTIISQQLLTQKIVIIK